MALLVAAGTLPGCRPAQVGRPPAPSATSFTDASASSGLEFTYDSGATGELHVAEVMGGGCALVDLDGDGDLDAYLTQGGPLGGAADGRTAPRDALLENTAGPGRLPTFVEVGQAAGVAGTEYGMGVAVGDVDNDGDADLYVTNHGPNRLLENLGDLRFADVTAASGTGDDAWSVGATFADVDGDGWLDLFVANYLAVDLTSSRPCFAPSGAREYCGPKTFPAVADRLFRNRGDGTFEDASLGSGIGRVRRPSLGVVAGDLDGDGAVDLYVAVDGEANLLWHNRGDGTFDETALSSGCALDWSGRAQSSMGVDLGDWNGDGDLDLVVTHMDGEIHTLYDNLGGGSFADVTPGSGLDAATLRHTGYGVAWLDADLDGRLDLVVANGAMQLANAWNPPGATSPLAEPDQLLLGTGAGFVEAPFGADDALAVPLVSRGLAVGDVDDDGDLDLLESNLDGPARLLVAGSAPGRRWLGLEIVGAASGRPLLGAVAALRLSDGRLLVRHVHHDGSYASSRDPRLVFGLSGTAEPIALTVVPPGQPPVSLAVPPTGRYTRIALPEALTGRR